MSRSISLSVLDRIQIASPCHVRWEDMSGSERVRFCGECRLNVYNLSAMNRAEAEELLSRAEGQVCAGFWRRADGTILTRDCPVGLEGARARAAAGLRRVAAAIGLLVGGGLMLGASKSPGWRLRQVQPFAAVCKWLQPPSVPAPAPVPMRGTWTGGLVAFPPSQSPAPLPAPRAPKSSGGAR